MRQERVKLLMLRSRWTGPKDIDQLVQQTTEAKFDGIEGPIPRDLDQRQHFYRALQTHQLAFVAEVATGCDLRNTRNWWIAHPDKTVTDHLKDLQWTVNHAQDMGALFVSTLCGYDAWSWQQHIDFLGQALELEQASGLAIGFETHRGRSLFNPWITRDLLLHYPNMKLTCDFSHWVVVCERLLESEWNILELCAQRALHTHCRVGYPQHAQVSDPRAPEYEEALTAHEHWWDLILQAHTQKGMERVTMTPEFLWDGYMQTLPYTQQPVADVWDITCWMANRERQRFHAYRSSLYSP